MRQTMIPMMVPALTPGERNARRSFRRNALVQAAAPRSWSSMISGEPLKESEASIRRRMVDFLTRMVSGTNSICRDDLLLQFDEDQIARHYRPALKIAGLHRLAVTW